MELEGGEMGSGTQARGIYYTRILKRWACPVRIELGKRSNSAEKALSWVFKEVKETETRLLWGFQQLFGGGLGPSSEREGKVPERRA